MHSVIIIIKMWLKLVWLALLAAVSYAQLIHTGPKTINKAFPIGIPRIWRDSQVPVVFEPGKLSEVAQTTIKRAMQTIEQHSCVRFVPHKGGPWDKHLLVTTTLTTCAHADLGVWQPSVLQLSPQCGQLYGVVLHELMHVLGFEHEHNRADRDQHITVIPENIRKETFIQFQKFSDLFDLTLPYDFASITHYSAWQKSNGNGPAFTCVKENDCFRNNGTLSDLDVVRINRLYCNKPVKYGICKNQRFDDTILACCRHKRKDASLATFFNNEVPKDLKNVDCCGDLAYDSSKYRCCWSYNETEDSWTQTPQPVDSRQPCTQN